MTSGATSCQRQVIEDRNCSELGFWKQLCAGVPGMSDLRFGVVGLGARSRIAQYAHRPGEGSEVVAVADPAASQRDAALELYPDATGYADHTELLDQKLDGVFITTPDD